MTNDALAVVSSIFSTIFQLFNSWYIPGTNVTPAVAFFGILFLVTFFRIFGKLFGAYEASAADHKRRERMKNMKGRGGRKS